MKHEFCHERMTPLPDVDPILGSCRILAMFHLYLFTLHADTYFFRESLVENYLNCLPPSPTRPPPNTHQACPSGFHNENIYKRGNVYKI